MKLGRSEDFLDNIEVRLRSIERAIAQYQFSAKEIKSHFADKVDEHTKLYDKGLGNEINFLSVFRELFFNSRELLDILLKKLNTATKGQKTQTANSFVPFAKALMKGEYDKAGLTVTDFLKHNITYIFHIRKIRNEIKTNPANITFRFVTNHFETYFWIPILKEDVDLIEFIDIRNKDEAMSKMSYHCTYNLDELFPEMLGFWQTCLQILKKDLSL